MTCSAIQDSRRLAGYAAAGLDAGAVLTTILGPYAAPRPQRPHRPARAVRRPRTSTRATTEDGVPESREQHGGGHGGFGLGLTGTVTAVGASSVTIKTSQGMTQYAVAGSSDIDKNGEATLSAVRVDDAVRFSVDDANPKLIDKLHAGDERARTCPLPVWKHRALARARAHPAPRDSLVRLGGAAGDAALLGHAGLTHRHRTIGNVRAPDGGLSNDGVGASSQGGGRTRSRCVTTSLIARKRAIGLHGAQGGAGPLSAARPEVLPPLAGLVFAPVREPSSGQALDVARVGARCRRRGFRRPPSRLS